MELVFWWIEANWLQVLQGMGITGGLIFTGCSLRLNLRIQRAQTLINITQQHRTLWLKALDVPSLQRILDPTPLKRRKVTFEERLFVNLLILHIMSIRVAVKQGVFDLPAGTDADLQELFSLPVPRKVWDDTRRFRDPETIRYIESLIGTSRK